MKIGVTSQNFKTITGHAGKGRRFLVYEADTTGSVTETDRWDLPKEMSMHEFRGDANEHPIADLDVLITNSCGQGFKNRLARLGVQVVATSLSDPIEATQRITAGENLPPPAATDHHHHAATATLSIRNE